MLGDVLGEPPTGLDALLEDFARRLEADGLLVERSVPIEPFTVTGAGPDQPSAAPPIEIVVRDESGRRRLAVETDGPAYAALPTVRDRDRMRAEHLGRLGWEHLRVWSTDIFRDPAREVARVRLALHPDGAPEAIAATMEATMGKQRDDAAAAAGPVDRPAEPVLEQTTDDTDLGWGEAPPSDDAHDEWLRAQRPPHWD